MRWHIDGKNVSRTGASLADIPYSRLKYLIFFQTCSCNYTIISLLKDRLNCNCSLGNELELQLQFGKLVDVFLNFPAKQKNSAFFLTNTFCVLKEIKKKKINIANKKKMQIFFSFWKLKASNLCKKAFLSLPISHTHWLHSV